MVAAAAAAALCLLALPGGAQNEGAEARVLQDGWWNLDTYPLEDLPEELGPVVTLVPPFDAPTTVPPNGLGVAARVGSPSMVAAVGIRVTVPSGERLDMLTLEMQESPDSPPALGGVTITACPITSFWATARNGDWRQRPPADCDMASVAGARSGDGLWTFDITGIGRLWLDRATSGLFQNGVLLAEGVGEETFETHFLDAESGGITLTISSSADPAGAPAPPPGTGPAPPPAPAAPPAAPPAASPTTGVGAPAPAPRPPPAPPALPPPTATTLPPASPPDTGAVAAPVEQPTTDPVAATVPGGLPLAVWLLIPLAMGLAGITMVVLGPIGEPRAFVRQGGISRALARRETAGSSPPLESS